MKMKALVTGGAGLIGSHIVDLLLEKGYEVRIFDNLEPQIHLEGRPSWIPKEAGFIQGDMRNENDLEKALKGIDIIFHQAAYGGFAPEMAKMTDVNALGTAKMLEIIRNKRLKVRKIVTASSQAVYGEGKYRCGEHGIKHPPIRSIEQLDNGEWEVKCPVCLRDMQGCPIDEETPVSVTGVYSISKYFQERLTVNFYKETGIPTVALRYSLTYGPRQSIFNPYSGICSIFSTRILNNLAPIVYEDGNQTRDFIYVKDVARANLMVAEDDTIKGEVFNVGTGKATKLVDFLSILTKAYNSDIKPVFPSEYRPIDLRHLFADITRIKKIGFKPKYSIESGIGEYIEWIHTNGSPKEYFSKAVEYLKELKIVRRISR